MFLTDSGRFRLSPHVELGSKAVMVFPHAVVCQKGERHSDSLETEGERSGVSGAVWRCVCVRVCVYNMDTDL